MVLPHPRCQCPAVTTTRRSHFWAWRSLSIKEHSDRYALLAMEPMMKRILLAENGLVKQQCQDVVNNLKHIWNRQQHDLHNSILSFLFNIYIYSDMRHQQVKSRIQCYPLHLLENPTSHVMLEETNCSNTECSAVSTVAILTCYLDHLSTLIIHNAGFFVMLQNASTDQLPGTMQVNYWDMDLFQGGSK